MICFCTVRGHVFAGLSRAIRFFSFLFQTERSSLVHTKSSWGAAMQFFICVIDLNFHPSQGEGGYL